jgi:hypothetical protein
VSEPSKFGLPVALRASRSPNQAAAGNGAIAFRFHAVSRGRAVPELQRSAAQRPTTTPCTK